MASPVDDLTRDEDFLRASQSTQHEILSKRDPDYAAASPATQQQIRDRLTSPGQEIRAARPESAVEGILRTVKDTAPFAGGLVGGAIGAAGGPVGAAAGAGLGYAGVKSAQRAAGAWADRLTGQRTNPPLGSPTAQAGHALEDLGTGATQEMGGQVMSAVPGPFSALKRLLGVPSVQDPATQEVMAAAARQGINLTAAAKSGSGPVSAIQGIPTRFPIGSQTATPTLEGVRSSAEGAARNLLGTGSVLGKRELGDEIQTGLKTTEGAVRGEASRLYDEALREGGSSAQSAAIPMTTTNDTAAGLLAREQRLRGVENWSLKSKSAGLAPDVPETVATKDLSQGQIDTIARSGNRAAMTGMMSGQLQTSTLTSQMIEELGLARNVDRSLPDLLATQQRLQATIRTTSDDYTKNQLRQLLDAVTDDVKAFGQSSGTAFGQKLATASDFYKNEVAEHFAKDTPIRRIMDKGPAAAAETVLRARDLDMLPSVMRELPAHQVPMVRRAILSDVLERSADPTTGQFSTARFMTQANRVPDEAWWMILPAEDYAKLSDIRRVFQRINQYDRVAANPSQTSHALSAAHQLGLLTSVVGGSVLAGEDSHAVARNSLLSLFSPYLAGKMIYSRAGQRFLSGGGGSQFPTLTGRGILTRGAIEQGIRPREEDQK